VKTELQEQLYKDYPDLFQESKLDMTQTCMCWGIECGDGWEPVIRNMCKMLSCRGYSAVKLKPVFPKADRLWMMVVNATKPLLRRLEKRLNRSPYSLRLPEPKTYDSFPGWAVKFTQIKEKFGTLRVYYSVYSKANDEQLKRFDAVSVREAGERFWGYVDGVTSFAEYISSRTCEKDGNPGSLTRAGWWRTLCVNCDKTTQTTTDLDKEQP